MTRTDVFIVGAGPIGLELAVSLQAAGVDYLHLDAGQVGQTISWYPRQAHFFSGSERIAIAGVPLVTPDQDKATREQYLAYLRGIVGQFDLPVRTYEPVTDLLREEGGGGFTVTTHKGQYAARRVVLAIGDMHRPRRLGIPGEDLPHVSHYFDEPHRYFRKRLLIVGGKNSAAEAALRCHRAGAQVTFSYRRAWFNEDSIKYWLMPELRSLIKHKGIGFHGNTLPTAITPEAVTLQPLQPGEDGLMHHGDTFDEAADFVLMMTGYVQDRSLFEMAGVELAGENRAPVVDDATMMTSVPGLYVAGTAAAGTQEKFRLFIENCHRHVARIVESITGSPPPADLINTTAAVQALPES